MSRRIKNQRKIPYWGGYINVHLEQPILNNKFPVAQLKVTSSTFVRQCQVPRFQGTPQKRLKGDTLPRNGHWSWSVWKSWSGLQSYTAPRIGP